MLPIQHPRLPAAIPPSLLVDFLLLIVPVTMSKCQMSIIFKVRWILKSGQDEFSSTKEQFKRKEEEDKQTWNSEEQVYSYIICVTHNI